MKMFNDWFVYIVAIFAMSIKRFLQHMGNWTLIAKNLKNS